MKHSSHDKTVLSRSATPKEIVDHLWPPAERNGELPPNVDWETKAELQDLETYIDSGDESEDEWYAGQFFPQPHPQRVLNNYAQRINMAARLGLYRAWAVYVQIMFSYFGIGWPRGAFKPDLADVAEERRPSQAAFFADALQGLPLPDGSIVSNRDIAEAFFPQGKYRTTDSATKEIGRLRKAVRDLRNDTSQLQKRPGGANGVFLSELAFRRKRAAAPPPSEPLRIGEELVAAGNFTDDGILTYIHQLKSKRATRRKFSKDSGS